MTPKWEESFKERFTSNFNNSDESTNWEAIDNAIIFIHAIIQQAKEEQREEIIKNLPSPFDSYGMRKNTVYYQEEVIKAIRNNL